MLRIILFLFDIEGITPCPGSICHRAANGGAMIVIQLMNHEEGLRVKGWQVEDNTWLTRAVEVARGARCPAGQ